MLQDASNALERPKQLATCSWPAWNACVRGVCSGCQPGINLQGQGSRAGREDLLRLQTTPPVLQASFKIRAKFQAIKTVYPCLDPLDLAQRPLICNSDSKKGSEGLNMRVCRRKSGLSASTSENTTPAQCAASPSQQSSGSPRSSATQAVRFHSSSRKAPSDARNCTSAAENTPAASQQSQSSSTGEPGRRSSMPLQLIVMMQGGKPASNFILSHYLP